MSRLSRAADRFKRQVLAREEQAATTLIEQYGAVFQTLSQELDAVTAQIIELQKEGVEVTRNLIYRRTRLQSLIDQTEEQLTQFAQFAEPHITAEQAFAVERAQEHSRELVFTALGPLPDGIAIPSNFLRFNPAVVEKFIGRASNGSPLRELLETLAPDAVSSIEEVFVKGIVKGLNPREVARQLRDEFSVPLHRAMTISRTEVLNAYRETNREFYAQNDHVVTRWRWQAAFNSRTCAMCLAMDGTEFETRVSLDTHPNCRCVLVPVTKSWAELGFTGIPDRRSQPAQNGAEWFAAQPKATQLRIVGPAKLKRIEEGTLTLKALVGVRNDRDWGKSRHERSLRSVDAKTFTPKRGDWGIMQAKT
jgi:SPP1 gp7 family putative phage head morphogenesis protein